MISPPAQYLLLEFTEFWSWMKRERAAGQIHERIVHRVREQWAPWWMELPPERRGRIVQELSSLSVEERKWFLDSLRTWIETDREKKGCLANGPGAGNWVFMQLAHVEPFENSQIFESWRLNQIDGFKALCLHPDKALPILCVLLRRGEERSHYEYNVRLSDAVGVLNALASVEHLLKGGKLFFFAGRPRGCAHHPAALRIPLAAALILGPLFIVGIYVAAAARDLGDFLLAQLLYGVCLCSLLFLTFWLLGLFSDWWTERELAAKLADTQVAWALGDVLPSPTSRRSLEVKGESFSAALALSIFCSFAARDNINCWIVWCLRRAARHTKTLGITGDLSPTGRVVSVDGFDVARPGRRGKKATCVDDGLTMLAPVQKQAAATPAETAAGLRVRMCRSLEQMIWEAAKNGSGFALWLGAAAATILVLFSVLTLDLVFPPAGPELIVNQQPILEDRPRHTQHLIVHFRTKCPQCFTLRVHSQFWKTPEGEQHMAQAKNSDVAVFEIELLPREDATGNSMDSWVEIQRLRELPFLRLAPAPMEGITFDRLNDMYERTRGVGKYAYPNH